MFVRVAVVAGAFFSSKKSFTVAFADKIGIHPKVVIRNFMAPIFHGRLF